MSRSKAAHIYHLAWALPLFYFIFSMTALYITGFNAAGGLQVLSFIVCAAIALQAKRVLGRYARALQEALVEHLEAIVFCGLLMAPGSYTFSQFIRRAPPLTLYPISCDYWLQRSVSPVPDLVYVLCPRLPDMEMHPHRLTRSSIWDLCGLSLSPKCPR
ncbi:hypothetical protein B0H14DRAFT_3508176 [Mycena olivaceomarginata]|nr:hypothetical protein B0H14DRAFT_3508176 [Mycena olivaceomarginata]